ncbi:hypothetical protein H4R18_003637 [Coemansia javaensis]|uniref:Uncharacterized protein n=1 Tax=Coemansia javaensis TaxID=2761396 RepID=A0A9W8HD43_9FUNG|nr:hypothetical protein H4R18_003637 [Coemansia javaensis]
MSWLPAEARDPTYYDVLKCEGEFATPSAFFSHSLRPARVSAAFPWPATSTGTGGSSGSEAADNKHRLRRAATPGGALGSRDGDSTTGSMLAHADSALPAAVFRLPSAAASSAAAAPAEPWALSSMTAGGRALRRAGQIALSRFDRKVSLA